MAQTIDDDMAAQLGILNSQIDNIFGRTKTIFLQTTARDILFDGIQLCVNVHGLAEIICDLLKSRELNTLKAMPDGSVNFALFAYVSLLSRRKIF